MKDEDTGVMEGGIISEENSASGESTIAQTPQKPVKKPFSPQEFLENLKNHPPKITKGKIIAIVGLILTIFILFIAFLLLSAQKVEPVAVDPQIEIASPEPAKAKNPEFTKIEEDIQKFKNKVDANQRKAKDFPPPAVDLNITF